MKKLAILMLGLGLAVGSVTATFAQDTKKEGKKQSKKKKTKKTQETKKSS